MAAIRYATVDAREDWASGEVGGFETYLIAEEDDDPEVRSVAAGDGRGG